MTGDGAGAAAAANADYQAWQARKEIPGKVQMWDVIQHLERVLPEDAIITNGAGNYTTWVHRFHRYRGFPHPARAHSGAMGYGVPAAIARESDATRGGPSSRSPAMVVS